MKRFTILLTSLLILACPVFAQNSSDPDYSDSDSLGYQLNVQGDQYLKLGLGPGFPLNFGNIFENGQSQLVTGGNGVLGYHFFLLDNFAVGVDATFGFNVTVGSHVFNYIPIVAKATYVPTFRKFEFPITLGIGFAWHTYIGKTYWPGLVIEPEIAVLYRISSSWGIGGEVSYLWMPEFDYEEPSKNVYGQFLNVNVTARYYF